jgi:hypothetical protein
VPEPETPGPQRPILPGCCESSPSAQRSEEANSRRQRAQGLARERSDRGPPEISQGGVGGPAARHCAAGPGDQFRIQYPPQPQVQPSPQSEGIWTSPLMRSSAKAWMPFPEVQAGSCTLKRCRVPPPHSLLTAGSLLRVVV